jgi:hypothetical protein
MLPNAIIRPETKHRGIATQNRLDLLTEARDPTPL